MPVEEAAMDTRTSLHRRRAALGLLLAIGLAGCNPVYTIHSIAEPSDEPSPVPDISGLWMLSGDDSTDNVLRVAELEYDVGQCRNATVQSLGTIPFADEPVGDEICFVPVAGHLIVQFRTTGQVQVYQQYLIKFDKESMSFCAAIWSDLVDWSNDHPRGTSTHGLEFTRRGGGDSAQLFVISRPSDLLSYLEARLPKAVQACDEVDEHGHSGWATYTRLTPPRPPDAAEAAATPPSSQE